MQTQTHPVLRLITLYLRLSFRAPSLSGGGGGPSGEKPLDHSHDTQRAQQGLPQAPRAHLLQRNQSTASRNQEHPPPPRPPWSLGCVQGPEASQRRSYDREGVSLGPRSRSSLLRALPPTHGLPLQAVSHVPTFMRGRLPSSRESRSSDDTTGTTRAKHTARPRAVSKTSLSSQLQVDFVRVQFSFFPS